MNATILSNLTVQDSARRMMLNSKQFIPKAECLSCYEDSVNYLNESVQLLNHSYFMMKITGIIVMFITLILVFYLQVKVLNEKQNKKYKWLFAIITISIFMCMFIFLTLLTRNLTFNFDLYKQIPQTAIFRGVT